MIDIYAKTFMTATGGPTHKVRDAESASERRKRWPWRGRRWKQIDLSKL
jgi:hypothetical protein